MINLLPPNDKKEIQAGKTNVLLLRYCIISLILAVPLFALVGGTYIIMNNSKSVAEKTIMDSAAKSAKYQEVQKKAQEYSSNLKIAKTILDKEVRYSEIAIKIAQTLPAGIILESLSLDAKTFGQPTSLNALAKSYDDSIRLKQAFESSPIFSDVHLQSVSKNEDTESGYPVNIVIGVTVNPEIIKS